MKKIYGPNLIDVILRQQIRFVKQALDFLEGLKLDVEESAGGRS